MSGTRESTEWTVIKPDGTDSGIWTMGPHNPAVYLAEGSDYMPPPPEGSYIAKRKVTYGPWEPIS